jgi:hypothetical protein
VAHPEAPVDRSLAFARNTASRAAAVQPFAESAPHATDLIDHFEELHSSLLTLFNKLLAFLVQVAPN